jgi:hypothetical protein
LNKEYTPADFLAEEKLYRGFKRNELNEQSILMADVIHFPDFSCNWSRYSTPDDIRKREGGRPTDGCFSFTVETARYQKIATTCHDPLDNNYSHTEVRQLLPDEDVSIEPPKARKLKQGWAKRKRLEFRQNLANNLTIELDALA